MKTTDYTIFIDESGRFDEAELERQRDKSDGTSQIAGVLARGQLYETPKERLPPQVLKVFPLKEEGFHTKDRGESAVHEKASQALELMSALGYQAIRICNNAALGEGKYERTYTHMVATLISRLYETLREARPQERPVFHLYYAVVKLGKRYQGRSYYYATEDRLPSRVESHGQPIFINHELYEATIRRELTEEVQFGLGLSAEEAQRLLGEVKWGSARRHPMLQLADVVSACSYRSFVRLKGHEQLKEALREALSGYDYALHPLRAVELAEELSAHRAVGQAIIMTLEELRRPELSPEAQHALRRVTRELVDELAERSEAERATDLRVMVNELEDLVQRVRDADSSERLIRDLERLILSPLEREVSLRGSSCELSAVRFKVLNLALANANHMGDLKLARERREQLSVIHQSVHHRFELLHSLMKSRLNMATSHHDAFELNEALSLSLEVAQFYHDMKEIMGAFEGSALLSPQLKIAGRGMALSSALRVERALLARGEGDFELARAHAQDALEEFTRGGERARVYQQLAHLEALAGRFTEAWGALAYGLDPHREAPPACGEERRDCLTLMIELLPSRVESGLMVEAFQLMHSLRLAAQQAWSEPQSLDRQSLQLLRVTREAGAVFFEGERDDYPTHAILRYSAELAAQHHDPLMIGALRALIERCRGERGLLRALPLVAIATCACVLFRRDDARGAQELLALKGLRCDPLAQQAGALSASFKEAGAVKVSAWIERLAELIAALRAADEPHLGPLVDDLYPLCQRFPI